MTSNEENREIEQLEAELSRLKQKRSDIKKEGKASFDKASQLHEKGKESTAQLQSEIEAAEKELADLQQQVDDQLAELESVEDASSKKKADESRFLARICGLIGVDSGEQIVPKIQELSDAPKRAIELSNTLEERQKQMAERRQQYNTSHPCRTPYLELIDRLKTLQAFINDDRLEQPTTEREIVYNMLVHIASAANEAVNEESREIVQENLKKAVNFARELSSSPEIRQKDEFDVELSTRFIKKEA